MGIAEVPRKNMFHIFLILLFDSVLSNSPARILTSNAERRSDIPSSGANKDMYYDYDYGTPPRRHVSNNRNTLKNADCRVKTRTLPHETYCDLYYHTTGCEGDQALLRSCPNGLLHTGGGRSGLIGACDYPHNVDCSEKEKHNPPISTEHCDWLYGIFGHETSCTRYWTCWNGTATEQFCIGGLLYNEETHACDWPQNVAGCQKHPLCKDDPNGNVPLGKSCNRYWACQGGYPRLQRCPAMLVFDKNRRRCVTPPTEDCEVLTTKAPPPGEENFNSGSGGRGGSGSGGRQQQSPNPRRGGGQRRQQQSQSRPQSQPQPLEANEPLPFNLPPGAVPLNANN